jgi:stringent starvation protein B
VRPQKVHHPIQAAIEDVYAAGHTPRLQIDARRRDVTVPDFIRRQWQARLVIDLDPSYPLDLEYGADGISVDLAFQGQVSRCKLAWPAVYAVIDRTTGRGIVVEAHLPVPELAADDAWVDRASKRPKLSALPSSQPAKSAKAAEAEGAEVAEVAEIAAAKGDAAEGEPAKGEPAEPAAKSAEDAAKERRARFRVIDGGR